METLVITSLVGAALYLYVTRPMPPPPPPYDPTNPCANIDCRFTDPTCAKMGTQYTCKPIPNDLNGCYACQYTKQTPSEQCKPYDCRTKGCPTSRPFCRDTGNPLSYGCYECCTDETLKDCHF
jgi:hypothetical protein